MENLFNLPVFTLDRPENNLFAFVNLNENKFDRLNCLIEGADGTQLFCEVRTGIFRKQPSILFYKEAYEGYTFQLIPLTNEGKKQIFTWWNECTPENIVINTLFPAEYFATIVPENWDVLPKGAQALGYIENEKKIASIWVDGEFRPL